MIKGLDHIAIAVNKIEDALLVFERTFGLKLEKTKTVDQQKVKIAILRAGQTKIELLEPTDPESTVAKFLASRGEGIHHIALEVSDMENHLKALKDKGIDLIDDKPRLGAEARKIAFIHPKSTKNVLIELVEH
ncbi:MAG TPA: methylmalonyl-CoA epimerase [Candidatus Bathyarchaeia archaeon]|nr:methylmalonyl-CoA epimerase [Candidatus Bathyarchaeia archaeon]